jgi:hypothetical protein
MLVLKMQNLEASRTKKTGPAIFGCGAIVAFAIAAVWHGLFF